MNASGDKKLTDYYREAESWGMDRERTQRRSIRLAWTIAGVATIVALCEAAALVALTPLKTVVPYTLLVDRQTGYVQALKPLDQTRIAPDTALTRSMLAQYVIAREGFDIDSVKDDYRKVALWSAGNTRDRYIASMQASNPASPFERLPRGTEIDVQIRSVSPLGKDSALVRFVTMRTDAGGRPQAPQPFVAVVSYRFSSAAMSEADRLLNPLGFQVLRYRRNAEMPPPVASSPQNASQSTVLEAPPAPVGSMNAMQGLP